MAKILIVDDDKSIWELYRLIFKKQAYELIFAENTTEASAKLDNSVNLILLDEALPGKYGSEYMEELAKDIPDPAERPAIYMVTSGWIRKNEFTEHARKLGYDPERVSYYQKPVYPTVLRETIETLLNK
ncbi:response regulator [Candidatus Woesearchaeota archaeon]|nr:response regulator [Candidatus Woesearchaeota archaeon]